MELEDGEGHQKATSGISSAKLQFHDILANDMRVAMMNREVWRSFTSGKQQSQNKQVSNIIIYKQNIN